MGAWLNQDYDVHHDDEWGVLADYAEVHGPAELAETIAELDAMLARPTAGLLDSFEAETGPLDLMIAEDGDDDGARLWLLQARAQLAAALAAK
jgi:hypothetical protein